MTGDDASSTTDAPTDPLVGLDAESARWLADLTATGAVREGAIGDLHALLLRAARSEARRRGPQMQISGPELDDVAHQAAADALMAVTAKLGQFQGRSRFTTWAHKFVVLEVASKLGRHWSRRPADHLDAEGWDRLPDRFGLDPAEQAEWQEVITALHQAVDTVLSARQRTVFVAIVLDEVPVDALAARTGSTRGALYKTLFDARRKLRVHLDAEHDLIPSARTARST